ncbi:hypothetical protein CXG81DRAFT_24417 [Caulochytrium protostelioides]|uniref:Transmembrane protein n=1 Tax=Caulochytrium protostelioides TaxID=1555241 RepID=A0A4P9XCP6_9FUNG|nr:hypothetical protein CXG81DRAFT_24417 [Caulochytrium protostelioides]|eukprot:RKP02921.1 hypothetical protein CXG81DRAFT_24417 [Caulochytrium protostelioides]
MAVILHSSWRLCVTSLAVLATAVMLASSTPLASPAPETTSSSPTTTAAPFVNPAALLQMDAASVADIAVTIGRGAVAPASSLSREQQLKLHLRQVASDLQKKVEAGQPVLDRGLIDAQPSVRAMRKTYGDAAVDAEIQTLEHHAVSNSHVDAVGHAVLEAVSGFMAEHYTPETTPHDVSASEIKLASQRVLRFAHLASQRSLRYDQAQYEREAKAYMEAQKQNGNLTLGLVGGVIATIAITAVVLHALWGAMAAGSFGWMWGVFVTIMSFGLSFYMMFMIFRHVRNNRVPEIPPGTVPPKQALRRRDEMSTGFAPLPIASENTNETLTVL